MVDNTADNTLDDTSAAARLTRAIGVIDSTALADTPRVSQGELGILGFLATHDGTAAPGELSTHLHITSARTANALRTLERKGYIKRTASKKDRRAVIVTLTAQGRAYGEQNYHRAVGDMTRLISVLTSSEQEQLVRLAERLAGSLTHTGSASSDGLTHAGTPISAEVPVSEDIADSANTADAIDTPAGRLPKEGER